MDQVNVEDIMDTVPICPHGVAITFPEHKCNKCLESALKLINKDNESDNVNHPPHYNNSNAKCECGKRIECIDITRHFSFNIGNAIKYLWRCDLKNSPIEDLRKAIWYINDEIKSRLK